MKRLLSFLCLLATVVCGSAQTKSQLEVLCGAELLYRDVNFVRLYDVYFSLTPAVKWHMGKDWQIAVQGNIPIANYGYGKVNSKVSVRMGVLSKQLHLGADQHFKLSAGFFGQNRYGLDLRWMYPVTDWLMLQARGGYTGYWQMVGDATMEKMDCLTGTLGVNVYLKRWNTEFKAEGGRYVYEDYGVEGDVFRHFKHCSVGLFARLHEKRASYIKSEHKYSGGFKIVVMLPPYKKSDKRIVLRPANQFHTSYMAQSDEFSMSTYATDPEDNQRNYAIDIDWGVDGAFGSRCEKVKKKSDE